MATQPPHPDPMAARIDPRDIDPNPWQPRQKFDMLSVAELADSLRAKGLLQPPLLRASPRHPNRYELAFGHRRLAAWRVAFPNEPFPCELRELSDRQMAEAAATENAHRQDLNPVERARGLKRLIGEFGMTQTEAGKLYSLTSQGAVSNAVRLLELPDKILDLVAQGLLPEKHARALIIIGRLDAKEAERIAEEFAGDEGERILGDDDLQDEIGRFFETHGRRMEEKAWPLDWLPNDFDIRVTVKGEEPFIAPKCSGCPYYSKGRYSQYCARPACYKAKQTAWANDEARRAAKRLGLALLDKKNGLPATLFYKGEWNLSDLVSKEVKEKAAHLRVAPCTGDTNTAYNREQHLGSRWVALYSVDDGLIEALKAAKEKEQQRNRYTPPDPAEVARQKAERERRYAADQALVCGAAKPFAMLLPAQPRVLDVLMQVVPGPSVHMQGDGGRYAKAWKAARPDEKRRMLAELILTGLHDVNLYRAPDPAKLREALATLARECKVKLAPGWDALPEEATARAFGEPGHLGRNGKKKPVVKKAKKKAKQ